MSGTHGLAKWLRFWERSSVIKNLKHRRALAKPTRFAPAQKTKCEKRVRRCLRLVSLENSLFSSTVLPEAHPEATRQCSSTIQVILRTACREHSELQFDMPLHTASVPRPRHRPKLDSGRWFRKWLFFCGKRTFGNRFRPGVPDPRFEVPKRCLEPMGWPNGLGFGRGRR